MPKLNPGATAIDEEYEDAFEALFEPGDAAVHRACAAIVYALHRTLEGWAGTRSEKARRLKIKADRLDFLLEVNNSSHFSLPELIRIAARAGLKPSIQFET